ncbi:murein hydrolase activator EnvC family protein [Arthrobacter sp. TMT4-20]
MSTKLFRRRAIILAVLVVTALGSTGSMATGSTATGSMATAATATATATYDPPWGWPLTPTPVVLRHFDPPAQRWLPGHRGVDLAAADGAVVLSPAPGRVVFAGWVVDRPVLTIDHGGGLLSSFEPVAALLDRGEAVEEGQTLGTVASLTAGSHCPAGCVHWGVRLRGEYVNPLNYVLDRRPSVLLPLHGP